MNINIRNKISFFEVHWDMNMQLVRDQIYDTNMQFDHVTNCSLYPNAPQKMIFYFLIKNIDPLKNNIIPQCQYMYKKDAYIFNKYLLFE